MPDNEPSIDQNPGRWLLSVFGVVLFGAGVQSTLTPKTNLSMSIGITAVGLVLIIFAGFWNKLNLGRRQIFDRLNRIASHPGLWVGFFLAMWVATMSLQVLKEIRLNNEIVQQRNDIQSIAKVLNRGLMPRHLTKDQQQIISNFLKRFDPHEFTFELPRGDQEAAEYGSDIEEALEKGGWTFKNTSGNRTDPSELREGLSLNFMQTQEHMQQPSDPKTFRPDTLLTIAFGTAGVRIDGTGGGGGVNVTEDRLTIIIGKRRMDSYQFTCPE